MFFGEYKHTIDSKGRIFLPAKLRDELGERFWVCKGMGKCLQIFTRQGWEHYCARLDALEHAKARYIKLYFFSGANETVLDSQGRIVISSVHRSFAELEKNVVVLGNRDHLEIWSEELWLKEQSRLDSEAISEQLISLGF